MSSAKAALESDTKVNNLFLFLFFLIFIIMVVFFFNRIPLTVIGHHFIFRYLLLKLEENIESE